MSVRRFAMATVTGAAAVLILGLVTGTLFGGLFTGFAVTAPELIMKSSPNVWTIVLGAVAMGALLTVLLGCWTDHTGAKKALGTSAVFGLLLHLFLGLSLFGMTTMLSLTGTLVKVVIDTVQVALAGMAVGYVLGCTGQN
ncbi:MAG: hypothetical protein F4Y38_15890 [Gemmatimonadetes bacterium]|nr:hypothetical protein [Gemmatimonadota bacterium]MYG86221.1 hypothetical protein [Gemmatimonadota bacterium]MYJ90279.1 hypothetical protein [Gemmatimonadota bacterium]